MDIAYEYDPVRNLVHTRVTATLTDVGIGHHTAEVMADRSIRPDARELIDLTGVEDLAVTAERVREFVTALDTPDRESPVREIVVVAPTDAAYGVSRMISVLMERLGTKVTVVRKMSEAEQYLGLCPEPLDPA